MKCNLKSMLVTAFALAFTAATAYFLFPGAKAFILAGAPLLLLLVCPVAMLLMMKSMSGDQSKQVIGAAEQTPPPAVGNLSSGSA
jgi:hypothetical protein